MEKKEQRDLIGIAVGCVVALGVISHTVTHSLINIAVARQEPRSIKRMKERLIRSPDTRDMMVLRGQMATALEKEKNTEVEIVSEDGTRLVGHWCPCPNAKRVLIAMHGWRSSWAKDFGAVARFWRDNGCSVLYVEQRGQNNSSGEYMTFGMMERHDCLSWIRWVSENVEGDLPIYLCGISMGASTVLMAAELGLPESVHGILADCGFTSPHAIWRHVVRKRLHLSYAMCELAMNDFCQRKLRLCVKELSTLHAMEKSRVPVLFIHGAADKFVPIEMTYENYCACKAPKRLLVVPGAQHGMSYAMDREAYERVTKDFWRDFDKKGTERDEEKLL